MMYTTDQPPTVVVVGNYGVGKSSFVKALLGDINASTITPNAPTQSDTRRKKKRNLNTTDVSTSSSADVSSRNDSEFQMEESELIIEARCITIDNELVRIVDTAARDVMGTQVSLPTNTKKLCVHFETYSNPK